MLCSWSRIWRLPGIGHIERGLLNERWWIHAPANEETSSAAEQHTHHQQEPKIPQPLYGEGPHTAPGATAVFIGTAYIVCGIESFKIPAMFFGLCALHQQPEQQRRHPSEPAAHGSREDRQKPGCAASSGPVRTPGPAGALRGCEPTPAEGRAASRRSSRVCGVGRRGA